MAQTEEVEAVVSPYLFKGIMDAVFYLIVYFGLPLYSIVDGFNRGNGTIYFTAFSCCICVIYDCYSRYDKQNSRSRTLKIYGIGAAHIILAFFTFFDIQKYLSSEALGNPWIYILLAVAPIIGGVDLANMILDDIKSRRC